LRPTRVRTGLIAALILVGAAGGAKAQRDGDAQLSIRLQVLEDELRGLRGELEVQRFRIRELEREVERLREAQGPAPASPAAPAAPGTPDDPARGGDGTAGAARDADNGDDDGRDGGTLGGGTAGTDTVLDSPTLEGEPTRRDDAPSQGSHDRGLALLQAGRYGDARREFEGFVAANPDDPRAAEAAFWAAETLYVEGDYREAAAAFAENYRGFGPDAPRAPDSLLKVALSLIEIGDTDRACRTLEALELRHDDVSRSLEAAAGRAGERAGCG